MRASRSNLKNIGFVAAERAKRQPRGDTGRALENVNARVMKQVESVKNAANSQERCRRSPDPVVQDQLKQAR